MSEAAPAPQPPPPAPPGSSTVDEHAIGLVVTDDLRRTRLTVFFRLLLAIPSFIWLALWGIAAEIVLLIAWFAALFTGRVPDGLHGFLASYIRFATRLNAYILLLANPFPGFTNSHPYPIDARIAPAAPQSRLTVFFRILIAIPALLLSYVFRLVNNVVALLSWFYALFTGQMNEGMRNISAWLFKYEVQTYGYIFLLTGQYPSLSGGPTL
jgi:ABC-type multidrug transport system fused ATPase/permease subunit